MNENDDRMYELYGICSGHLNPRPKAPALQVSAEAGQEDVLKEINTANLIEGQIVRLRAHGNHKITVECTPSLQTMSGKTELLEGDRVMAFQVKDGICVEIPDT